jgi:hypothetical protein
MNESNLPPVPQIIAPSVQPRSTWKKKLLVTFGVFVAIGTVTAASAAFWYEYNFHASPFRAVQLTQTETQTLNQKMEALKGGARQAPVTDPSKTLVLSEREINGYLEEQGLGEQIKVSIRNGNISATALMPVDKDVPFLGGQTVRFKISLGTKLDSNRHLALCVSDINVGGISAPNAWLGGIKGKDLLADNNSDPVLKGFADGIKDFQVIDGEVRVLLND